MASVYLEESRSVLGLVIRLKIYRSLVISIFPPNGLYAHSHIVRNGGGLFSLRQAGQLKVLTLALRIDFQKGSLLPC